MTVVGWQADGGISTIHWIKNVEAIGPCEVETTDESGGKCDCCGNDSSCVWGMVHKVDGPTVAAYWMHLTVGHLNDPGANLDLVVGPWGEGTTANERYSIALLYRQQVDGAPSLMVVDYADRPIGDGTLAATAVARGDVIGTPLAPQVVSIIDAIYEQDGSFF
jgi:hypothetical protein